MIYKQHFIIEGKHLGTADRKKVAVHEKLEAPMSYGFFCQYCGDLWAKAPVVHFDGRISDWQCWHRECKKCSRERFSIPGSLWISWDASFNASFPDDVIRWEFERCMALYPETETIT